MTNFQDSSPDPDPDFSISTNKKLTKIFGLLLFYGILGKS